VRLTSPAELPATYGTLSQCQDSERTRSRSVSTWWAKFVTAVSLHIPLAPVMACKAGNMWWIVSEVFLPSSVRAASISVSSSSASWRFCALRFVTALRLCATNLKATSNDGAGITTATDQRRRETPCHRAWHSSSRVQLPQACCIAAFTPERSAQQIASLRHR